MLTLIIPGCPIGDPATASLVSPGKAAAFAEAIREGPEPLRGGRESPVARARRATCRPREKKFRKNAARGLHFKLVGAKVYLTVKEGLTLNTYP